MMKNKLIPKRRFKEFENDGAWEQRKLGEIATFSKGRGYSKNDLTEVGTPIVLYGRLYTKYQTVISGVDTFAVDKPGSVYSSGNEVIVPSSGETAEDIARASAVEQSGVLLGGDLNIIYPNYDVDSAFLAMSVSNGEVQKALTKRAQGKSVVHLHNTDLQEVELSYPSKLEQVEISRYFRDFDNLITLHQRKLKKLKETKLAYLSEMFPKEGEKYPKRRFVGFADPWEQRKLGELLKADSLRPYLTEPSSNGKYEVIQQGDKPVLGYADGNPYRNYKDVVLFGDHTLSLYKPNSPFFVATDGIKIISGIDKTDGDYLLCLLEKYKPQTEGYKRYYSILKDCYCYTTPNKVEQNKIGQFFIQLDNLITLHQRKLEKLENIKKAYLNEMFV